MEEKEKLNGGNGLDEGAAREALRLASQERARACAVAISEALAEHKCQLVGVPFLDVDQTGAWRIRTRVDVVPITP